MAASGLVAKDKNTPLPLKSVSVEAQVKGFVLGLHSTLTYSNDASDPVEVLFRFPIEKSHAVVGLTAIIDGRKIKADIREKEEARAQYDDAIASGLSAALAEEKSGDIFSVALGNLPPGKEAQIQLRLVGELSIDAEGGVRFSLPSTLKPRYTPAGSTDPLASVPTGEGQQVESGSVSAVSWFHMTVEGAEGIAEVTSPTHSISVALKADDQLDVHLSKEKELGGDLVILLKMKEPHAPKAMVEGGVEKTAEFMSSPAVMVNFYPDFAKVEAACEFIFLVDRSGSMSGSYISSARETLVLFLKSIPEGNYFNIIGFGSSYKKLFPDTVPYDEQHLEKAIKHAQEMEADLGGTELLTPLQYVFGAKSRSGYSRQIFVLTDGSVSNTNACIQQMKSNVKNARCFTFGIGSGASTALVEGLARAGNGTAEFVKEGERMQPKVIRSLKRALQPAITNVSALFQVPKEYEVLQSPQNLPPIFNGEKLVVYAVLKSKKESKKRDCTAILRGNLLGKMQEHKVLFTLDSPTVAPSLPVIHHLAAKALIADWESENKDKKSIVDLSIESSVISPHTAFIAVDEESSEPVSSAMKTYTITAQPYMMYSSKGRRCGAAPQRQRKKIKMYSMSSRSMSPPPPDSIPPLLLCAKGDGGSGALETTLQHKRRKGGNGSGPPHALPPRGAGHPMSCAPLPPPAPTASSTAKRKPADKPIDNLASLVTAQQVNGSWALSDSLAQLIGKSFSDLESACPIEGTGTAASVWATVLAVSLLRAKYSSQQDEWELIAMKAESWLKKQTLPSGCTLEQLFQAAEKTVQ